MMPAHSVPYLNNQIIVRFADFLIQSHTQFFFPIFWLFWLTEAVSGLGPKSFRSVACLFSVCFGDFICRIIWNIVLVLHIACFPFNYKLIHDFEGPFLLSIQLSISMPIDQCTYRRFYCTHPL